MKIKELIKSELAVVYITTDHRKYIKHEDAVHHELRIQNHKDKIEQKRKNIMNIKDVFLNMLKENGWGIYHHSNPIQSLQVKDGPPLFRVNKVEDETVDIRLEESLVQFLNDNRMLKDIWSNEAPNSQNTQKDKNSESG